MSRRPGLGATYLETHTNYHREAQRYYSKQKGIYQRLPRYFKDKMFDETERTVMAEEAEFQAVLSYRDEIERLRAFHSSPYQYYAERTLTAHDSLTKIINKNDKF